jgi:hypothetical protein
MMPLLWLLLLVTAIAVKGQIISVTPLETQVTDVVTGATTYFTNTTVTLACGSNLASTYFRDNTPTPRFVIVRCNPPKYIYTTDAKGTVPSDVILSYTRVCPSENPSADDPSYADGATSGLTDSVSRRRLLSTQDEWVGTHSRKLLDFLGIGGSIDAFTCSVFSTGCVDGGGGGFTSTDITDLNNTLGTLKTYVGGINARVQLQAQFDQNQTRINQNNILIINNTLTAIAGVSARQDTEDTATRILAKQIDDYNTALHQAIAQEAALTAAGLQAESSYTDAQVYALQQAMYSNVAAIHNYTAAIFSDIYTNLRNGASRTDVVETFARRIGTNLYLGAAGINLLMDRALRKLLWSSVSTLEFDGYVPFVDPAQPGIPPTTDITDPQRTAFLDAITYSFVNTTGSVYTAHEYTLDLLVSNGKFFDSVVIGATWRDYLTALGPIGCVGNATAAGVNPVHYCTSWISISHRQCVTTNSFQFISLAGFRNQSAHRLSPSMCTQSIVTGAYDGRLLDSMDKFNSFLQQLCDPNGIVGTSNQIQFLSRRFITNYFDVDTNPAACSDLSLPALMRSGYQGSAPIAQIFNTIGLAFAAMATERRNYDTLTFGLRPAGTTTVYMPFFDPGSGRSFNCYSTYLAMTRGPTVVSYRVAPNLVEPSFSYEVWDTEPTCTGTVCTSTGTLLDSGTYANVLSENIVGSERLLNADDVIFGELSPTTTSVSDVSRRVASLDPNPIARIDTAGYLRCDFPVGYDISTNSINPDMCNLADWESQNSNLPFEHNAVVSLSDYTRSLTGGTCDPVTGVDNDVLCSLLDAFFVDQTTDMRSLGLLVLSPKAYSYTVQVPIKGSTIQLRVDAGCPAIAVSVDSVNVFVSVTNNFGLPLSVKIHATNANSACPSFSDVLVQVQGKQTYNRPLSLCGNYTAIVSAIGDNGQYQQCGSPINIPTAPKFQSPFIPTSTINFTSAEIADVATQQAAQVVTFVTQFLALAISYTIPSNYPGITPVEQQANATAAINAALLGLFAFQNAINVSSSDAAQQAINSSEILSAAIRDTIVLPALNAATAVLAENVRLVAEQANLTAAIVANAAVVNAETAALVANINTEQADLKNQALAGWIGGGIGGGSLLICLVVILVLLCCAKAASGGGGGVGGHICDNCGHKSKDSEDDTKREPGGFRYSHAETQPI